MEAQLSHARTATTAVFFVTGAVSASWASRIPAVQERLELSAGTLSLALLALEAGAVVGLPLGGVVSARFGSRWSLRLGFLLYPAALLVSGLAPSLLSLALVLGVMAAANSVVDVAMNTQGVEIQARYRRPVLSRMHAGHSFGVLAGALCGTAAAAADLSTPSHFATVAALAVVTGLAATGWLIDEPVARGEQSFVRPRGALAVLGLVAFCVILMDATSSYWSALHLRTEQHASATVATVGFTAFALTVAVGRLVGDRLVARLGRVRFVQVASLVAALGSALVVAAPSALVEVLAWATLGAGLAAIPPTLFGAAPAVSAATPPVAIAAIATCGYLGSFTGPPLVGALAEITNLSAALGLLIVAAVLTSLLARRALSPVRDPSRQESARLERPRGSGGASRLRHWRQTADSR